MKKSLIALAVVGAFTAQAAMADTTVYGAANVSFDVVNSGLVVGGTSTNHVASNVSKLGFKGSEDLGDGLSAVFQIEQQIDLDNSGAAGASNSFGTRNTFAGLSSASMGTVLLGRHDTPYKIATRGLDLFADTIADNRSIMGLGGAHDARLTDVAAYISPAMSGFTVAIATVAGAETATTGTTKGGAWSLAGMYNAGPIGASLSYQALDMGTAGTGTMAAGTALGVGELVNDKATAWKLGAGYTMDQFAVNAIYEKTGSSGLGLAKALDRTAFYLAGKFSVSANDAVKAAYTSAGKLNSVVNTESTQFSIGYDHNLSKRTTVYALYSKISNKAAANATFSQATSVTGAPATLDADPSVWSLGMKHAF